MAYTKNPMQSTEQTKIVPLMYEYQTRSRDGLKDTDALNILWEPIVNQETGDNYFNALKRDGSSIILPNTPDNAPVIGLFYWSFGSGLLIVVTTAHVYVYTANGMLLGGFTTYISTAAQVGGVEFLYQNGNRSFFIFNGVTLLEISSALVFTPCVDPDCPTNTTMTDVETMDGYLFIGNVNGTISNSDLNNPQSWSASNFTQADSYGDPLVALKRTGPYLVALGRQSIQYYYDAANPTGTPLGAMPGSTLAVGCVGAVVRKENTLFFVGVSSAGIYRVYQLENFKPTDISTPAMIRWLTTTVVNYSNNGYLIHGTLLSLNGHTVYHLSQEPVSGSEFMYGYDLDTALWSRFQYAGTTNYLTCATTGNMATNFNQQNKQRTVFAVKDSNGMLAQFEPQIGSDFGGGTISCSFVTPQQDFGTYRVKFGSRMVLWTDKPPSTSSCLVSWTDDDYQTFSTPRSVDLFQARPSLYSLGKFNRRSFKIDYTGFFPMRWKNIELDYDQGTQ